MDIFDKIRRLFDPMYLLDTGYKFEELGDKDNTRNGDIVRSRFLRGNARSQIKRKLDSKKISSRIDEAQKLKW